MYIRKFSFKVKKMFGPDGGPVEDCITCLYLGQVVFELSDRS